MKISEIKKDLFAVEYHYSLAQFISADYTAGSGVAEAFDRHYGMRRMLVRAGGEEDYPDCIQIGRVFSLVTKEKHWHKPTYGTLKISLMLMKNAVVSQGITHIAMPKVGTGIATLEWSKVKSIIVDVFEDTDVEILICDFQY